MSDRCVFAPYVRSDGSTDTSWADVVVPEHASVEEIHAAAEKFSHCRLPLKVFIVSRDDPRFIEFKLYLDEEHDLCERDEAITDWNYRVILQGELP